MDQCIFCKIIKGDIPSDKVYEDELVYAFRDINPSAPTHVLIIPKAHIESLEALEEKDKELAGHLVLVAQKIARQEDIASDGYRLVANCGELGGQEVKHLHFHLLGGRKLNWPAG